MRIVPVYGVTLVRDASIKVADKSADSPVAVVEILRAHIGNVDREHFVVMFVNARNQIIGINTVSVGTLSASLVHPRLCAVAHKRGNVVQELMLSRS